MEQYGAGAKSKQQKYFNRINAVSFTNHSLPTVKKAKWLFAYGICDLEVGGHCINASDGGEKNLYVVNGCLWTGMCLTGKH